MAEVAAKSVVAASLADAWELYFDPKRWSEWVEGFGSVTSSSGYPEAGGTLVWQSGPAGRGMVSERVLEHQPRSLHRVEFADSQSRGELSTSFAIEPGATGGEPRTRVKQVMSYRLVEAGLLSPITDLLFVRSAVRRSLERSLAAFAAEAADPGPPATLR